MRLILLAFLAFISTSISAQQGWEAGGMAGIAHYRGDINTSSFLNKPGVSISALARYNFNNRICLKIAGTYGRTGADDANSSNDYEKTRNLSFRTDIFDGSAQLEFNFMPYVHGSKEEFFSPYLFLGASVFKFDPQAFYDDRWIDLRPLGTEGQFKGEEYFSTAGAMVFGGGFKLSLTYEWSINIEVSARKLFTDYFDDVSTVYPDMEDLESLRGELSVALSDRSVGEQIGDLGRQRGDAENNDMFTFANIGIVYYFGDIRCPEYGSRK